MKATGIVRRIDRLGRVVLPIELRRNLGIEEGEPLEIYTEKDNVILHKYNPCCAFCGGIEGVIMFKGKKVCLKCIDKLNELQKLQIE